MKTPIGDGISITTALKTPTGMCILIRPLSPRLGSRWYDVSSALAGNNTGAPATDQRGFARPQDGDGDGTATVDIGAVERTLGQIHGLKFHDRNRDGVQAQDGSEPGLAGWTIYLDTNNNGALDTGEPSTVTMPVPE